jgi:hypothetical protein
MRKHRKINLNLIFSLRARAILTSEFKSATVCHVVCCSPQTFSEEKTLCKNCVSHLTNEKYPNYVCAKTASVG